MKFFSGPIVFPYKGLMMSKQGIVIDPTDSLMAYYATNLDALHDTLQAELHARNVHSGPLHCDPTGQIAQYHAGASEAGMMSVDARSDYDRFKARDMR